jgi:hypothetical protein
MTEEDEDETALDDWSDLLHQLKQFKGQFYTQRDGHIRHRDERVGGPGESRYEHLCPLNALCRAIAGDEQRDSCGVPLQNGDFNEMAEILKIDSNFIEDFAEAADQSDEEYGYGKWQSHEEDRQALRRRIIEAVC